MMRLQLTPGELDDLRELESVIELGIRSFHEVSRALLDVQRRKLYAQHYDSFEDYCQRRWGFSRAHGYRLVWAGEVLEGLEEAQPRGDNEILPECEKQTRPLKALPAEDRAEVWSEACAAAGEGEQPAAARVKALAEERLAEIRRKAIAGLPAETQAEIIRTEEDDLRRRAEQRERAGAKDAHKVHLEKIAFHARQCGRHAEALGGDEGQAVIDLAGQIKEEVERLESEAA